MKVAIRYCGTWARSPSRAASLAAEIKERLGIEAELEATDKGGQFDVVVDGETIASRGGNVATRILFGAGFPEPGDVIDELAARAG